MTEIIELIMPIYKDQITELDIEASSGELVRCKYCKNAVACDDNEAICDHIDSNGNDMHPIDWFCADGKKRDDDG